MKNDSKTITDSGTTKTTQRTGRHASRPEEVLFFPTAHFLFFNATAHLAHLQVRTSHPANPNLQKSQNSPTHNNNLHNNNNPNKSNMYKNYFLPLVAIICIAILTSCSDKNSADNFSYKLIPVQSEEKWGYIADSFRLRNRQLLVAAKRYLQGWWMC